MTISSIRSGDSPVVTLDERLSLSRCNRSLYNSSESENWVATSSKHVGQAVKEK